LAIARSREIVNLFLQEKYHTVNIPTLERLWKGVRYVQYYLRTGRNLLTLKKSWRKDYLHPVIPATFHRVIKNSF